jgi:hypothetical protein
MKTWLYSSVGSIKLQICEEIIFSHRLKIAKSCKKGKRFGSHLHRLIFQMPTVIFWCNDTQHNDTRHNDIQYNGTHRNNKNTTPRIKVKM